MSAAISVCRLPALLRSTESTLETLANGSILVKPKPTDMSSVLQFLKIADSYERKARFFPAFLVVLPVMVFTMSLRLPDEGWVKKLLLTGGAGSVLVVGLAHMASAAGNRFGETFWKSRDGLPTVRWLRKSDASHSSQQIQQWYDGSRN